ncbi:MAG: GNAT family N-acetyltransferase [Anaerolineaceae bacterium]|nr:GNAT family N-acetyltransferase [Anaerolineaceae bacterium]
MHKVIIRPVVETDLDGLNELFNQIDRFHAAAHPERFREAPGGQARPREYFLELIHDLDAGFFVADQAGELQGFVHVIIQQTPDLSIIVPRLVAKVDNLGVREGQRGKGIGRTLMEHAEHWAKEKGAVDIELNVYEFNIHAQRLYQRMGYQVLSKRMGKRM